MWNSVRHSIFFLKNEKKISWNCVEIIKSNEKYLLKLQIFHYGRKCYNSLQVSRIDNTHFFLKYIKTFRSQINNAYLKLKYLFLHSLVLQNLPLTNCFFSLHEFQYHQFHYYLDNLYMNIILCKIILQLRSGIGCTLLILAFFFFVLFLQLQASSSNSSFIIIEIVYIVCYLRHSIGLSNTRRKPFFTMVLLLILTKMFPKFFFPKWDCIESSFFCQIFTVPEKSVPRESYMVNKRWYQFMT